VVQHLMPDLRKAALLYAERGWSVFPLVPGDKKPLFAIPTPTLVSPRDK
jgi:hypothetical protein